MKKLSLLISAFMLSFVMFGQVLNEGFEGSFPPTGWTLDTISGSASWVAAANNNNSTVSARTGSNLAYFYSGNYNDDQTLLITPSFDISLTSSPELRFYHSQVNWGSDQDSLRVFYKTSTAGSWVLLATYNTAQLSWIERVLALPNASNDYYIAFEGTSSYGRGITLDDITVDAAPNCVAPTSLVSSNITVSGADLAWTDVNSATEWEVVFGTSGFTRGIADDTISVSTTASATLIGLLSNTSYDYYVRAICGVGDTSSWSAVGTFKTAFQCPAGAICGTYTAGDISSDYSFTSLPGNSTCPGSLTLAIPVGMKIDSVSTFYDATAPSAGGGWMSEQRTRLYSSNTMLGEPSLASGIGDNDGTYSYSRDGLTFANNATGIVSIDLEMGRTYGGSGCGTNVNYVNNNSWTVIAYYSAAPACLAPSLLSSNVTSSSTTELNWTENGTATEWEIIYGTTGFTLGVGGDTVKVLTDTFTTVTGLTAVTSYDWYIRAVCAVADSSSFTGPNSFTTPCAAVTLPYLEDFSTYIPSCWNEATGQLTNNTTFTSTTSSFWIADGFLNVGSSGSARMNIYSTGRFEWLISPSIDLGNSPHNYRLEFDAGLTDYTGSGIDLMGPDDTLSVVISTDNGATWSSTNVVKLYDENSPPSNSGETVFINLSAYTGLIKVGFYATSTVSNTDYNVYIDNFQVRTTPACPAPSANAASQIGSNSAVVSWLENGTATEWEVIYGTAGFTLGVGGDTVKVLTDTFTTVTGLTAVTAYDYYVRAVCAPGDTSAFTSASTFTTPCAPVTAPFTESFDNTTVPTCWSRYQATGSGWVFGTPGFSWNNTGCAASTPSDHTGNSGNFAALDFSVPDAGVVLELPTVDVSALNIPMLTFYFQMCGQGYSPLNELYIEAFDGTSWNVVTLIQQGTVGWEKFEFIVSSSIFNTNQVKLRFRAEDGGGTQFYGDMAIDDVSIIEAPSCPKPSNLTSFNTVANSTEVSWQENLTATLWLVEWDTAGYAAGTARNSAVVANDTTTLTGLMQLTNYDWAVRAICGPGDSSLLVNGSFSTLATCPPASALSSNVLSPDSAVLNWTNNSTATSWEIEYGPTGFTLGAGVSFVTLNNPDTLSGLMPATTYQWYVRAICSSSDSSTWTGPNSFTTLCAPYLPPYSEDFTTFRPNCWDLAKGQLTTNTSFTSTTSSLWIADGFLNVGTSGSARMNIYSTGRFEWLMSPSIDLGTAPNNYRLEFDAGLTDYTGSGIDVMGPDDTLSVVISTDNGATWSSSNVVKLYDVNSPPSNTGETVFINLSAYTGLIKVGFYATSTVSNTDYNVYIDNFQVRTTPACPAPSANAASLIGSDSAVVSWTENGSAVQWEVEYGTTGYTLGSGTSTIVNVDTFMTIAGLTSNTSYDYYVRAICGNNDTSAWTSSSTFKTTCGIYTAPFTDDVELHAATSGTITTTECWEANAISSSNDWNVGGPGSTPSSGTGPSAPNSGNRYFYFEASSGATGNEANLISPSVDVTSLTVPMIEFYYHMFGDGRGIMGDLFVDVFDGTNYTVVDSIKGEQQSNQADPFLKRQISLASVTGVIKVRFRAYRGTGAQWGDIAIDDISVKEAPSCFAPTTLTVTSITSSSATLNWTENNSATSWEIEYDTAGFTLGTGNRSVVTTNPASISGLAGNKSYDFYVRSICGSADSSLWTGPRNFLTLCSPFTAPFLETFDGSATPTCWSQSAVSGGPWVFGGPGFTWNTQSCTTVPVDHTGNSGSFAALDFSVPDAGVVLELPDVDISSLTAPYFEFYYTQCNGFSPSNVLYIEAFDGASWDTVSIISNGTNGWERFGFTLANFTYNTNLVRLRFRAEDGGGTQFYGDMGIDDVTIKETPADNLAVTAIVNPNSGCGLSATSTVEMTITNLGSAAQSNFSVGYSVNGVAITPETYTGTIAPNASANYIFTTTANLNANGTYAIEAYTSLTNDYDNSNDSLSKSIISLLSVNTFPYAESFETSNGGWISGGVNSSWALGAPTGVIISSASNGTQAWVTNLSGQYGASEFGFVNSPCFDFTSIPNPYLELDIFYDIEFQWDGALIQASSDQGVTWSTVGAQGDTVNWYNDTADAVAAIDPTGQSWTGDATNGSQGWITAKHAIDGMGGLPSVQIRVLFISDGFVFAEGFAFDNVKIYDKAPTVPTLPYYPIGTINTVDATTGVADSIGVNCWTSGTVAGVDLDGNVGISFTIVDQVGSSTQGINIFNFNDISNYVVNEGDSIMVRGGILQFNGLTELSPDSIRIIATGKTLPAHTLVSSLSEATESQLIEIRDFVVITGSGNGSYNMTATNGTDTLTIRVDADTDVNDSLSVAGRALVAGDTICSLKGIGGQFDNSSPYLSGYQIFPMRFSDIDTTSCLTIIGIKDADQNTSSIQFYPNPNNGQFKLQIENVTAPNSTLEIVNIQGQVVYNENLIINGSLSKDININVEKGIYFVKLSNKNGVKVEKLIIE